MRSKALAGVATLAIIAIGAVAIAAVAGAFRSSHAAVAGASGNTDSIKVHGAWIVQVKDHGRLVKTVRFHNELAGGAQKLVQLLSRQKSMGQWMILVLPAMCGPDGTYFCWIDEGIPGTVAQTHTVVVSTPTSGADDGKLVLKANFTPTKDAAITQVQTSTVECPPTSTAADPCHDNGFGSFSQRTLPTPIDVVSGQQVLITVKYSFS